MVMLTAGTLGPSVEENDGHIFVYKMDSCVLLDKSKKTLLLF